MLREVSMKEAGIDTAAYMREKRLLAEKIMEKVFNAVPDDQAD